MRENSQPFSKSFSKLFFPRNFQTKRIQLKSNNLKREVDLELIYPKKKNINFGDCFYLFINDGQDLKSLQYHRILEDFFQRTGIENLITIGMHAGERLQEYGVVGIPDYKGRGSKADQYQNFMVKELFPYLENLFQTQLKSEKTAITGFSLGGLSAFDFAWNNSELVSKVGVFSGSFWWRKRELGPDYTDADRIIHSRVLNSENCPRLKFWFQAGTLDEKSDRNQNGIIDSIDDTLDLASVLESRGYLWHQDITYFEVEGGEHNPKTWSKAMPIFLDWAFNHS